MRILQVCKKFPYPIKDGEVIAITNVAKALHRLGNTVDLLCINTPKHFFDKKELPESFDFYNTIETVAVDTDVKVSGALLNLFSSSSYHISRFVDKKFEEKLIDCLKAYKPEIVQLETLFLAPYVEVIRQHSTAKLVMRAHNVESEIWERIVVNTKNPFKQTYLKYLTQKLKRFEQKQVNSYDLLLPITNKDLSTFENLGFQGAYHVVPIGINHKDYDPDFSVFNERVSISFIGSLDWLPNQEGMFWFLDTVWGKVNNQFPDLMLHIAGRNTPQSIYDLGNQTINIHGEIPDAKAFINEHPLMIVPLLSGSGMRVKILEGMALGRVVITTSVGVEGIDAIHQKHILLADTAEDFYNCIKYCIDNPNQLLSIGQNARDLIIEKYDNLTIAKRLSERFTN